MSPTNVAKRYAQIQVCKSYARVEGEFRSVLSGIPTELIGKVTEKTEKATLEGQSRSKADYGTISDAVSGMGTIEKLATKLAEVVTAAKTNQKQQQ